MTKVAQVSASEPLGSQARELVLTGAALDGHLDLRHVVTKMPWSLVWHTPRAASFASPAGDVVLFAAGAVVWMGRGDIDSSVAAVIAHETGRRILADTRDAVVVLADPGRGDKPQVEWDSIVVAAIESEVIQVVALLLAQSVALERYERAAEQMIEETGALVNRFARRGRPPWQRGLPVRRVALLAASRIELDRWFFLLDRPETTWDDPEAASLFDALFAYLELAERHRALLHKISTAEGTLRIIIGLWEGRRSRFLEWAIVLLIVLEIVLAFGHL